jgi:hypothetical protein
MKIKVVAALLLGLCLTFISSANTLAESSNTDKANAMIAKQKEIDKYIFEDKKDELAEKGIMVTHTAPLETTVEIGISPFNEENANYFYDVFGKSDVTVVKGEQVETLNTGNEQASTLTPETSKENKSNRFPSPLYISAFIIVLAGLSFVFIKKKRSIK